MDRAMTIRIQTQHAPECVQMYRNRDLLHPVAHLSSSSFGVCLQADIGESLLRRQEDIRCDSTCMGPQRPSGHHRRRTIGKHDEDDRQHWPEEPGVERHRIDVLRLGQKHAPARDRRPLWPSPKLSVVSPRIIVGMAIVAVAIRCEAKPGISGGTRCSGCSRPSPGRT